MQFFHDMTELHGLEASAGVSDHVEAKWYSRRAIWPNHKFGGPLV